jgi:hypothetical protein
MSLQHIFNKNETDNSSALLGNFVGFLATNKSVLAEEILGILNAFT